MSKIDDINGFTDLFSGGTHAYGRSDGNSRTVKEELKPISYEEHLNGIISLGVIPIRKNATCNFGAIDLDCGLDFDKVDQTIKAKGLPLVICRSKSGGIHLYTFFEGLGIQAPDLRALLGEYVQTLALEGIEGRYANETDIEIFPKQNYINELEGKGNWINMPYYGLYHDEFECERVAFFDGEYRDLTEFVKKGFEIRELTKSANPSSIVDLAEPPPCIKLYLDRKEKVPKGSQNNYIHQCAVFFKKVEPDIELEDLTVKLQKEGMEALSEPEYKEEYFKLRAKAVLKKDYNFSCGVLPFCNKIICQQLTHGIDSHKVLKSDSIGGVYIGEFTKILTEPPTYNVFIGNKEVSLDAEDLADHSKFRKKAMQVIDFLFPRVKEDEWTNFINEKFRTMELFEAPEDAGEVGGIRSMLKEFAKSGARIEYKSEKEVFKFLSNGRAVRKDIKGIANILFKGPAFERYCKENKFSLGKSKDLWNIARKSGFENKTVSIDGHKENCWTIELAKLDIKQETEVKLIERIM